MAKLINIEHVVTGPLELVHWPECRGGDACRCVESGTFITRGMGFFRRDDPAIAEYRAYRAMEAEAIRLAIKTP